MPYDMPVALRTSPGALLTFTVKSLWHKKMNIPLEKQAKDANNRFTDA